MTQLILNISDPSILPDLRKAIEAIDGVTILKKEELAKIYD